MEKHPTHLLINEITSQLEGDKEGEQIYGRI